jgi:hypothetical protein
MSAMSTPGATCTAYINQKSCVLETAVDAGTDESYHRWTVLERGVRRHKRGGKERKDVMQLTLMSIALSHNVHQWIEKIPLDSQLLLLPSRTRDIRQNAFNAMSYHPSAHIQSPFYLFKVRFHVSHVPLIHMTFLPPGSTTLPAVWKCIQF